MTFQLLWKIPELFFEQVFSCLQKLCGNQGCSVFLCVFFVFVFKGGSWSLNYHYHVCKSFVAIKVAQASASGDACPVLRNVSSLPFYAVYATEQFRSKISDEDVDTIDTIVLDLVVLSCCSVLPHICFVCFEERYNRALFLQLLIQTRSVVFDIWPLSLSAYNLNQFGALYEYEVVLCGCLTFCHFTQGSSSCLDQPKLGTMIQKSGTKGWKDSYGS